VTASLSTKTRITEDALFDGKVRLFQPAQGAGYRTNVDALLLAAFASAARGGVRRVVDLGAGVGAVGLALFHRRIATHVDFVEREPDIAALCRRNLDVNGFGERGQVFVGDLARSLKNIAPAVIHAANLVVANPPYFADARDAPAAREVRTARIAHAARDPHAAHDARSGRDSNSPRKEGDERRVANAGSESRERARHGDLAPFVRAAADALGRRGRACFVYPAHATLDLLTLARSANLEAKRLRFVHGKADRPARIALVEFALAKAGGLVVEMPLIETAANGRPTDEMATLVGA
jgi:tRNA1(Val) A37 N6-methylase TrmN6